MVGRNQDRTFQGGAGGPGGGSAAATTFDDTGLTIIQGDDVQEALESVDTALETGSSAGANLYLYENFR